MKIVENPKLREFVEKELYADQSPPIFLEESKNMKNPSPLSQKIASIVTYKVYVAGELKRTEEKEKPGAGNTGRVAKNWKAEYLLIKGHNISTPKSRLAMRKQIFLFPAKAAEELS